MSISLWSNDLAEAFSGCAASVIDVIYDLFSKCEHKTQTQMDLNQSNRFDNDG